MINLAKCCNTCGHCTFAPKSNTALCTYWSNKSHRMHTVKVGKSIQVCKPWVCDFWIDPRKKSDLPRPNKRWQYWLKELKHINEYLKSFKGV